MNTVVDPTARRRSTSARRPRDRHVVLRHRLATDGVGAPVLVGLFFLAVMAVVTVAAQLGDVRISGWEVGTHVARWFIGGVGVYLTAVYLPLYVTHGLTRREAAAGLAMFAPVYAILLGVLFTAGFALESLVYRLAGWTHGLEGPHLFAAVDQYHLVVAEYTVVAAVWLVGGAMLGAAFYRNGALGLVLLPVALSALFTLETATSPSGFGPFPPPLRDALGLDLTAVSAWGAMGVALAWTLLLGAIAWAIVRDVPIRPSAT